MKKISVFLIFLVFGINLKSQIISFELEETWTILDVNQTYTNYSIPSIAGEINYEVNGYKVTYWTPDYDGSLVICSGAIFLPVGINCPTPILSWQHGTATHNDDVPSNLQSANNILGIIAASHGYIVMMSDYIGLGEGEGIHNYVHADTEASSIIDLIIYGKEFAVDMNIEPNNQLFLLGYSQGGHATMAAVREIEENYSEELQITASAPMAGPYSMSGAQAEMLEAGEEYPSPAYLPYVLFAYNKIYNLYDDINEVLVAPYSDFLLSMYDGTNYISTINATLPSVPIEIFEESYYQEYLNNEDHPFKLALIDNDVYDFTPQAPMRLLHCNGDDNVTYQNAVVAYNSFIDSGAENVELIDGGNLNHEDCFGGAVVGAKLWIDSMVDFCNTTISENETNNQKTLIKIIDFLGRNLDGIERNKHHIYIYSDGSVKKEILIK